MVMEVDGDRKKLVGKEGNWWRWKENDGDRS